MKNILAAGAACLWLVGGVLAMPQQPPQIELQAAIRTETVGNDLKAAVRQFNEIIAKYPGDRVVTATALVHLAECYRRLGDTESQKIYQKIVREFADQPEAVALARARLAPSEAAADPRRRIWTLPSEGSVSSSVSYDGRYVAYVSWSDAGKANLFVHTFGGGADRRVTETRNVAGIPWKTHADQAAFSRDGRQLAFSWIDENAGTYQLRVVPLTGIASVPPRVLVNNDRLTSIDPYDWTADGKWIAAIWRGKDKDSPWKIGLVSAEDGQLRELKSIDRPCACNLNLSLSPDGKYLAFDLPGAETRARDIFVLDTGSAKELPAVIYGHDDELVGWSPDGESIIFVSDRTGATGLWAQPFIGGQPGTPKQLKANLGPFGGLGITATGALFSCQCAPGAGSDIKIASFDFAIGQFLSPPVDAVQEFVGTNFQPFWSPDGKSFVYRSERSKQDPLLVIQDTASGDVRELRARLSQFMSPRWSPDGQSMAVMGRDFNNRFGWYHVDAQTGRSSPIIIYPPGSSLREISPETSWSPAGDTLFFLRQVRGVEFLFVGVNAPSGDEHVYLRLPGQDALPAGLSPDQRTLFYQRPVSSATSNEIALVSRDLASGSERELLRRPHLGMRNDMTRLPPDGRSIAVVVDRSTESPAMVLVVPTAGGPAREVFRTDEADALAVALWAPDGGSLIVRTPASTDKPSNFWWVPLDGRPAHALTEFAGLLPKGLFLHPDGKRILFGAAPAIKEPAMPTELWVWEGLVKR